MKHTLQVMPNIIRLTNEYILKNEIKTLPIKIDLLSSLLKDKGFSLLSYQQAQPIIEKLNLERYTELKAFTYINRDGIKLVLYKDDLSISERNFAIAHELGHIVLEHIPIGICGMIEKQDIVQENEADTFAYQLLAPLCILKQLKLTTVSAIENETLLNGIYADTVFLKLHGYEDTYYKKELLKQFSSVRKHHKIIIISAISAILSLTLIITVGRVLSKPTINKTEEIVYITSTGNKYHKLDCHYLYDDGKLKDNVSSITLSKSIETGYTPCSYCFK